jgi:hypothetical protein
VEHHVSADDGAIAGGFDNDAKLCEFISTNLTKSASTTGVIESPITVRLSSLVAAVWC